MLEARAKERASIRALKIAVYDARKDSIFTARQRIRDSIAIVRSGGTPPFPLKVMKIQKIQKILRTLKTKKEMTQQTKM
jgi:hypothetical protein